MGPLAYSTLVCIAITICFHQTTAACNCNKAENFAFCRTPSYMGYSMKSCTQVAFELPLPCGTIKRICEDHPQLLTVGDIENRCPPVGCHGFNSLYYADGCCRRTNSTAIPLTTAKWKPPKAVTVPTTTTPNTTLSANVTDSAMPREDQFDIMVVAGVSVGTGSVCITIAILGICCFQKLRRRPIPANVNDIRLQKFASATAQHSGRSKPRPNMVTKAKTSDEESNGNSCTSSGSEDSLFTNAGQQANNSATSYKRLTNVKVV